MSPLCARCSESLLEEDTVRNTDFDFESECDCTFCKKCLYTLFYADYYGVDDNQTEVPPCPRCNGSIDDLVNQFDFNDPESYQEAVALGVCI